MKPGVVGLGTPRLRRGYIGQGMQRRVEDSVFGLGVWCLGHADKGRGFSIWGRGLIAKLLAEMGLRFNFSGGEGSARMTAIKGV